MAKMTYEVTIGIEIHLELNTASKMFSNAANDFNAVPNTNVSVIDLGYPGTLPQLNKMAVVKALQLAQALNMQIDYQLHFDRKHYFYFDLPKGYQITQQRRPIARNGKIETAEGPVAIAHFHLEEDTAQSLHNDQLTLLNYNRAGVPLIEIVTAPVMHSAAAAVAYIKAIRELVLILGISDAKMEEGSLRADINLSLKSRSAHQLGTKVEIKNLNSLTNVRLAIEAEIATQTALLDANEFVQQSTKRFNEARGTTQVLRIKTNTIDYRYYPEPNIVPVAITPELFALAKLPELPWHKRERYARAGVEAIYIEQLLEDINKIKLFEAIDFKDKKLLARVFFSEIVQLANTQGLSVDGLKINPREITNALNEVATGKISNKHLKIIIPLLQGGKVSTQEIMLKHQMVQVSDEAALSALVAKIISANQMSIDENITRPERLIKFILGEVMKQTKGQANPVLTATIVKAKLGIDG